MKYLYSFLFSIFLSSSLFGGVTDYFHILQLLKPDYNCNISGNEYCKEIGGQITYDRARGYDTYCPSGYYLQEEDFYFNNYAVTSHACVQIPSCDTGDIFDIDSELCVADCTEPTSSLLGEHLTAEFCSEDLIAHLGFENLECFESCDGAGFDLYGDYPTTDSDGDGYTDYDENQAGTNPQDPLSFPDSEYENDITSDTACESIPYWSEGATGIVKTSYSTQCTTSNLNQLFNATSSFVDSVDTRLCEPDYCLFNIKSCIDGYLFDSSVGYCVNPLANDGCVQTINYDIVDNGGVCQKNLLCEDGSVYDSYVVSCADTPVDMNVTVGTDTLSFKTALQEYGVATAENQRENIKLQTKGNDLLITIDETINKNFDSNHQDLVNIDNSIKDLKFSNEQDNANINNSIQTFAITNHSDLSAINSSISNLNDTLNSKDFSNDTNVSINIDNNSSDSSLASIDSKLSITGDDSGITGLINGYLSEFGDFRDNVFNQYNVLQTDIDSLNTMLGNGFVNNLPMGSGATTCPLEREFYISTDYQVPISIDFCSLFSPHYDTFYYIFLILFFGIFSTTAFNLLINTRT